MPNTKEEKIIPEPSPTGEVLYNPTTGEPISTGVTPTGTATGGANQPYSVITGNGATPSTAQPPANNPTPITTPSSGSAGGMSAKSYAQWLYSQSLNLASEQRKQVVDASEITRKRSIADANSSYMKSLATYGQNAEKMASMGLSGSGYGEYLTSQAYAQKRSTVQNANALHLKTEKEAIYQEKVAKQEALSTYHANMLQAQAEQNNAYNSLLSAASSGSSIESIMASGQWGLLSADQQTQIKNIAQSNSFKLRIDGGESIEDIMADANYNTLSADAQQSLQNYYQTKQKNDANAAATAYTNFINLLSSGTPLTSIQGMPYYNLMTRDQIAEFESIEAYNTAIAKLRAGVPLSEIETSELWSIMNEKDRNILKGEAEKIAQEIAQDKFETANNYDEYVSRAISSILSGQRNLSHIMEDEYYKQGIQSGNLTEQDIKNIESAAKFREYYNKIDTDVESFVEFSKTDEFNNLDEEYKNKLEENAKNAAFDKLKGMLEDKSIDEIESEHADLWALLGADEENELKEMSKGISEDKIKQQQGNHATLRDLIKEGMSVDSIKKYYPNLYNDLGEVYKNDLASYEAALTIIDELASSNGKTLADIQTENPDLWNLVKDTEYAKDVEKAAKNDEITEAETSDTTYNELWNMFTGTQESYDHIKNTAKWNNLNAYDKATFEREASKAIEDKNKAEAVKSVSNMITAGRTWDEIQGSDEYKLLTEDQQSMAWQAHYEMVDDVYDDFMEDAEKGISNEDDPRYSLLSTEQKDRINDEIERYNENQRLYEDEVKNKEYTDIEKSILNGDFKSFTQLEYATKFLDDEDKKEKLFDLLAEDFASKYRMAENADAIITTMRNQGHSEDDAKRVVKVWQNQNLNQYLQYKNQNPDAYASVAEVEEEIANGKLPKNAIQELRAIGLINDKYSSSKELSDAYRNGEISASDYILDMGDPSQNTTVDFNITKLQNGEDDRFYLYIENDDPRRLKTGSKVTESSLKNALDRLAPNANRNGFKLVVYEGQLYLYTDAGWMGVTSYDADVDETVARIISHGK